MFINLIIKGISNAIASVGYSAILAKSQEQYYAYFRNEDTMPFYYCKDFYCTIDGCVVINPNTKLSGLFERVWRVVSCA